MIHVINISKEDYSFSPNYYYIGRDEFGNMLSNPYTHLELNKTIALYKCSSREEAVKNYEIYFDAMYGKNIEFTKIIDEIYEKYKNGEEVFLGCWCDQNKPCHGQVIVKKLQERLIKEKLKKHNIEKHKENN